ncbi:heterokaryon incompatibility domain-containing protein [Trichoderma ceciliae]
MASFSRHSFLWILHVPALSILLSMALLSPGVSAQSSDNLNAKVWAVVAYINHGEKTPTLGGLENVLTPIGARQMWRQGSAFRNRYLGSRNSTTLPNSTGNTNIQGIATDAINNDQLTILSQADEWVAGGSVAFLQGLYPPTTDSFNNLAGGQEMAQDVLLPGSDVVDYPLGGYQYPNIQTLSTTDSASVAIQGTIGCYAWDKNVNAIKQNDPTGRSRSTQSLYRSLFATPPLKGTLSNGSVNYWNAYGIYEYVNYMNTHNKTVNAGLRFANDTIAVLRANAFELERAKNGDSLSTNPKSTYNNISSIAGQTLAMQIASSLSSATQGSGSKLTLMFGSFEPMLAFFSLMGLYSTDNLLSGPFSTLPSPGSAMIFELIGQDSGDVAAMPSPQEFMLRFTYRANADVGEPFSVYPLFSSGSDGQTIPYTSFLGRLQRFAQDSLEWCRACRAVFAPWCSTRSATSSSGSSSESKKSSVSAPVAGVIGAVVTLAVTGLAGLALYIFGPCTFGRRPKTNSRNASPGGFKGAGKMASDVDVAVTKRGMEHERVGSWELRDGSGEPPTRSAGIVTTSLGGDTPKPQHLDDEDDISITEARPVKIRETLRRLACRDFENIKTVSSFGLRRARVSHLQSIFSRHAKKPVKRRGFKYKASLMDNNLPHRPKQSLSIPEEKRFVYRPLGDSKCVRFLILQPGSGSDALVGSLQVGSLDPADIGQLPPYEAISYVWGTNDRRFELLCDGAILPLTQSIRDALMRVRLPDEPRRLWADQICINQDDIAERSRQVKLMNAVYKNAGKVLVWLGRDPEGVAADAVRTVHYLDGVFKDDKAHEEFKVAHEENLEMQSSERWIPLAKLTKLRWFHRIWIVQEIGTTAPATLYWGDAEMDWDMLSFVAGILNERYHHLRTRFFIGTSNIRYLYKRFVEPDTGHEQDHNRGNFAYELHRARHLLAQDPRDHVYAFLGHFSIGRGSMALQDLVADYSKSIKDVYVDVAVRGLRDAKDLVMLAATHHSRPGAMRRAPWDTEDIDLPSWVPDWRDLPVHILGSPAVPHRASKDNQPDLTIDEDSRVLHIRGVRVDLVERHSWTIYGTAFQVRQDAQGKTKGHWWKHRQHEHSQAGDRVSPQPRNQNHARTPSSNNNNTAKSNDNRALYPRRNSLSDQHGSRTHPMEVLWKQICGYQTFTLSHVYPPFIEDSSAATSSKSPSPSASASTPDHRKSAFFALIQTLTNACTGMDRTRPYSSISSEEWLASGAAYLVRYALPSSSSLALSPSQTFPSFPSKSLGVADSSNSNRSNSRSSSNNNNNIMSSFFERANSLSSPHTPISPAIHTLSLTGDPFKWSHEAILFTRYRRFAITRKGYFVLGPDALQEDDVVAVLRGGKTPFLLRRVSSGASSDHSDACWTLVGECYVHGLMDGEGWDVEGVEEEVFSIR